MSQPGGYLARGIRCDPPLRVIVTGCASGMGEAVAAAFIAHGSRVVGLDIDPSGSGVVATAERLRMTAHFLQCDVSSEPDVQTSVARAASILGGLDALVHVAAIACHAPAAEITLGDWNRVMTVNATSTMLLNRAVYSYLRDSKGSILNFASPSGVQGTVNAAHYSASKGAVLAWSRALAKEWGPLGIRVNVISPGVIDTPMQRKFQADMAPAARARFRENLAEKIPLERRIGDPSSDVAPVCLFLASPAASYITGQTIPVDGGFLMLS